MQARAALSASCWPLLLRGRATALEAVLRHWPPSPQHGPLTRAAKELWLPLYSHIPLTKGDVFREMCR